MYSVYTKRTASNSSNASVVVGDHLPRNISSTPPPPPYSREKIQLQVLMYYWWCQNYFRNKWYEIRWYPNICEIFIGLCVFLQLILLWPRWCCSHLRRPRLILSLYEYITDTGQMTIMQCIFSTESRKYMCLWVSERLSFTAKWEMFAAISWRLHSIK